MKRRSFIGLLSVATTAWPFSVGAQQRSMPVVGWLNAGGLGATTPYLTAFRRGLGETGYVEGENVAVEYRWADDQYDRVPALAADLVNRKVDVIATIGSLTTVNAARKAAGEVIPIVFGTGGDPVALGLVTSVPRPGANLTGVSYLVADLGSKRLDLLVQAVPRAKRIALLVNPKNPSSERNVRDTQDAPSSLAYSCWSSRPLPKARSTRPSLQWSMRAPARSLSRPTRSSIAGARNSWRWRPGWQFRRSTLGANSPPRAA
jgi:putative ABC transport system substrate-binding protein